MRGRADGEGLFEEDDLAVSREGVSRRDECLAVMEGGNGKLPEDGPITRGREARAGRPVAPGVVEQLLQVGLRGMDGWSVGGRGGRERGQRTDEERGEDGGGGAQTEREGRGGGVPEE